MGETALAIKGGNYPATIGRDGWAIFRDIPIMGFVPKGVKGAPEDIDGKWMTPAVNFSQTEYKAGNFAAPVHKGHHKSLAIEDPEFLGFFLPKRVGKAVLEGKEQDVVFADIKLKPAAFETAKRGELPYISPEIDWESGRFMSLSFLDSNPPHFRFPNFTVGSVTEDKMASFEAVLKFDDEGREKEAKDIGVKDGERPAMACCGHCKAYSAKFGCKFSDGGQMPDQKPQDESVKPPASPVEPSRLGVMEDDPKMAAKFAAQADQIAALTKRLDAKDAEAAAAKLEASALADLKEYQIGDSTKALVGKFARDGEAKLKELVAAIKESAAKNPPTSMAEFMSLGISPSDPALAKFQKSPAELDAATRALAGYQAIKKAVPSYSLTPEQHVEITLRSASVNEGGF